MNHFGRGPRKPKGQLRLERAKSFYKPTPSSRCASLVFLHKRQPTAQSFAGIEGQAPSGLVSKCTHKSLASRNAPKWIPQKGTRYKPLGFRWQPAPRPHDNGVSGVLSNRWHWQMIGETGGADLPSNYPTNGKSACGIAIRYPDTYPSF